LPIVAQPVSEPLSTEPRKLFPRRRILVVDDNCDAAETLATLLETLGATVSIAHSGREALEAVDRFEPDAVLLDIGMPAMDGFEVSRRIRATSKHADILLIALTGWGQDQDRQRSHDAGFDHPLVKPPDLDKLRELLAYPRTRHAGSLETASGA
jgi:CheY-like chemotaxis protein